MVAVAVKISRFVDDHQPGFVECQLVDASGNTHSFIEKSPVVSNQDLLATSSYPCAGNIVCEIVSEYKDAQGRLLVQIDTDVPFGVESTSGQTKFVVLSSQLVR
jgi:hypothetical protein